MTYLVCTSVLLQSYHWDHSYRCTGWRTISPPYMRLPHTQPMIPSLLRTDNTAKPCQYLPTLAGSSDQYLIQIQRAQPEINNRNCEAVLCSGYLAIIEECHLLIPVLHCPLPVSLCPPDTLLVHIQVLTNSKPCIA